MRFAALLLLLRPRQRRRLEASGHGLQTHGHGLQARGHGFASERLAPLIATVFAAGRQSLRLLHDSGRGCERERESCVRPTAFKEPELASAPLLQEISCENCDPSRLLKIVPRTHLGTPLPPRVWPLSPQDPLGSAPCRESRRGFAPSCAISRGGSGTRPAEKEEKVAQETEERLRLWT